MKSFVWNPWLMALEQPDRPAVAAGADTCSFADLVARADRYRRGLAGRGVGEGAVVATDLPSGPDLFALVLAALRGGFGLFPLDRDHPAELRARLLAEAGAVLELSAQERPLPDATPPSTTLPTITLAQLAGDGPDLAAAPAAGFLVFVTSGTTGEPKVVARARPRLPYRGVAVEERYHCGPGLGPHLMSNPTYHLGTLGPALYALQAGSAVVVQPQWSPEAFVELVDAHRADTAFLSPNFVGDVVRAGALPRHRLLAVFHGGFACPPPVKQRAIELLGPVLHEYYGTSEAVVSEIGSAEWLQRPGSVGRPLPGVRVTVELDGRPQPAGRLGEVVVSLRAADRTSPAPVRTGDLGRLDEDGYLFIVGRMAGASGGAAEAYVEQQLRALPGVTDAAVLPAEQPDRPATILVEVEVNVPDPRPRVAELAGQLAGQLPGPAAVLRVGPANTFERTRSGKLRRQLPAGSRG